MSTQTDYLKDITEIRTMMERSSRFISLSGLAGVSAGIFALAGAMAAWTYLDLASYTDYYEGALDGSSGLNRDFIIFCMVDALLVLMLSLGAGIYFTTRKAKKQGLQTWDKTAMRLLINLFVPLVAGGLFCLALLLQESVEMVVPATLIFYGLALLNGSKYTLNDIRYLGICEIILGIIASFYPSYGFLLWIIGFGALHIFYGIAVYLKYEQGK